MASINTNFTQADGALAADWTMRIGSLVVAGNAVNGVTPAADAIAEWSTNAFTTEQFAEITIVSPAAGDYYYGVATRINGTSAYAIYVNPTDLYLLRFNSGTPAELVVAVGGVTVVNGDRLRLEVTGVGASISLRGLLNGSPITAIGAGGIFTDSSVDRLTSGSRVGLAAFARGDSGARMDDFSGGDLSTAVGQVIKKLLLN